MSHKQKFKEILAKLKAWGEDNGNDEFDQHLKDLENEINASFAPQSDEEGDGGGNHPTDPPAVP